MKLRRLHSLRICRPGSMSPAIFHHLSRLPSIGNQEDYSKLMKIRNDLSLAVAILLISGCLSAQVQLSDTPAAHQLSNWLNAFNSGDRATFLAFLQKNYPARAGDVDGEMGFREETGGFELKQAADCADAKCSAVLKERASDQFARIVVDVDPAEPHAIKGIELRAIPRPAEFSIPRMTEAEALKAFQVYLDRAGAADRFSGAASLSNRGIVWTTLRSTESELFCTVLLKKMCQHGVA
jgi:hypothetical protein